jgi:hypothetical protein
VINAFGFAFKTGCDNFFYKSKPIMTP